MRRKTHEEFMSEVSGMWGDEFSILGKYIKQSDKVLVRHNPCGKEYMANPYNLTRGNGCIDCFRRSKLGKSRRLETSQIIDHIVKDKNNDFELLEHYYRKGLARVRTFHKECETISDMEYQNFKNSCGCSHCAEMQRRKSKRKTTRQFQEEIQTLYGYEYIVIGKYAHAKHKTTIKHNICGTIFEITPTHALRHRTSALCPECGAKERAEAKSMTHKEFLDKINEVWGEEYSVLSEYDGSQKKIRVRHNNCGMEYEVVPASILAGCGCLKCCMIDSKANKRIEYFLQSLGISYEREFKIKDCKYKRELPFDFAILEKGNIKLLIEYDGEQHFKPVEFFGGEEAFRVRQRRDAIKDNYCEGNNINLLRISYEQENNIEDILKKELC